MKKISLLLVVLLVLIFSGCVPHQTDEEFMQQLENEDRLEFIDGLRNCYDSNFDDIECDVQDARFYDKEEVDELISVYIELAELGIETRWEYLDALIIELQERIEELEDEE